MGFLSLLVSLLWSQTITNLIFHVIVSGSFNDHSSLIFRGVGLFEELVNLEKWAIYYGPSLFLITYPR